MSRKRSISSSASSPPAAKRMSPVVVETIYYYVLCQAFHYETVKPRTHISRCYTTADDAVDFVREMVRGWDENVMRVWEEFDDDGEENKLLVRVTTNDVLEGEEITITVQRQKVPVYTPPPPTISSVYIIVQKDIDTAMDSDGVVTTTMHNAYAERKDANQAARRVLRDVCGDLDNVGRIACRHEESMDEKGLYSGCAYVEEERRCKVEVEVERMEVR